MFKNEIKYSDHIPSIAAWKTRGFYYNVIFITFILFNICSNAQIKEIIIQFCQTPYAAKEELKCVLNVISFKFIEKKANFNSYFILQYWKFK